MSQHEYNFVRSFLLSDVYVGPNEPESHLILVIARRSGLSEEFATVVVGCLRSYISLIGLFAMEQDQKKIAQLYSVLADADCTDITVDEDKLISEYAMTMGYKLTCSKSLTRFLFLFAISLYKTFGSERPGILKICGTMGYTMMGTIRPERQPIPYDYWLRCVIYIKMNF